MIFAVMGLFIFVRFFVDFRYYCTLLIFNQGSDIPISSFIPL